MRISGADFNRERPLKQRRASAGFTAGPPAGNMHDMITEYPRILRKAEWIRVLFHLEFQEPYNLTPETALRLRRDLREAAKLTFTGRDASQRFHALFDPPLTPDLAALRRYQRPGPPFVIFPPAPRKFGEGDVLELEVLFWGVGMNLLPDFALALEALGQIGWHRGKGRFELAAVEGRDAAGASRTLWKQGCAPFSFAPPVLDGGWWLETAAPCNPPLELTFVTPARLLAEERPLFRPTFARIFPFLLRRVTSILHACCGIEVVDDPAPLLGAAAQVKESASTLAWSDWRTLRGEEGKQDLGGVTGSLCLDGAALEGILWVLALATMVNVGKGASFGAGHLRLREI